VLVVALDFPFDALGVLHLKVITPGIKAEANWLFGGKKGDQSQATLRLIRLGNERAAEWRDHLQANAPSTLNAETDSGRIA